MQSSPHMDYAACTEELERIEADVTAAELHGTLCALLCTRRRIRIQEWMDEIVAVEDLHPRWGRSLCAAAEISRQALEDGACELELLLPEDDVDLSERGRALADWCAGFLFGFGLAGASAGEALSEDGREVVSDLSELTRLDTALEPSEAAERDYAELVEYVRAGVLLVYEELMAAGRAACGHDTLH